MREDSELLMNKRVELLYKYHYKNKFISPNIKYVILLN